MVNGAHTASERAQWASKYIRMDADEHVMGVLRMEKPNWEMEEFKAQNSLRSKEKTRKTTEASNNIGIARH